MGEKPPKADRGRPETDSERIEAETDELLRHIESRTGSMFAVHADGDAEELDPGNLHADELDEEQTIAEGMAHGMPLDEPVDEDLDAEFQAAASDSAEKNGTDNGHPTGGHRGLKVALVIAVIALIAVICAAGYVVWQGNGGAPATTQQADTEALDTSSAGAPTVDFQEIGQDKVPRLASVFGKSVADAKEELGAQLELDGDAQRTSDKRVKALRQMLEGTYLDASGNRLASVGLGTDKDGKIVYAYVLYNLDDIGVESATFAELVMNNVVGTSVLENLGAEEATLGVPKLASGDPSKEQASYKGSTGRKSAPKSWELSETYTYTTGDTAVRTLLAELY